MKVFIAVASSRLSAWYTLSEKGWYTSPEIGWYSWGEIGQPGLIVSNTEHNLRLPTVVVVPLSSRGSEIWPLRLILEIPSVKKSYAVLPGLRQVDKTRLCELLGTAPQGFLNNLDQALQVYLND